MKGVSRSWFAVYNNPEEHGYEGSPEEILETFKNMWIQSGRNGNHRGFWSYCISANGLKHIHMILESGSVMRFSYISKVYGKAHLEPTLGSRAEVLSYIKKEGKYAEKGERVIATLSCGNIEGYKKYASLTKNELLQLIDSMIDEGKRPNAIMDEDIRLRQEDVLVKKQYFAKAIKDVPVNRKVIVYWHTGPAGSGKTYTYVRLCEKYGEDNVYLCTDYSSKGTTGFDMYTGEKVIVLDEIRPNSLSFEYLLQIMQGYKTQVRCRYVNSYALWDEVHVTTIYTPEQFYESMIAREVYKIDTLQQLLRRITMVIYHYKENDSFKTIEMTTDEYLKKGLSNREQANEE